MSTAKFACRFESDETGRVTIVVLSGSLDPLASEELGPKLQEVFRSGCRKLVFDLADLDYIGSLGIRLIVGVANQVKGQGSVAICNPKRSVRMVIELTHLDKVIRTFPSRSEAVGAVRDS